MAMALRYRSQRAPARPIYSETSLARLATLPWMRHGQLPMWFRELVFAGLPQHRQRALLKFFAAFLEKPKLEDAEGPDDLAIWHSMAESTDGLVRLSLHIMADRLTAPGESPVDGVTARLITQYGSRNVVRTIVRLPNEVHARVHSDSDIERVSPAVVKPPTPAKEEFDLADASSGSDKERSPQTRVGHFYISRTGADKALAIAIAAIIREAGYTTWLQDEDFGHANFMARMEQGLESGARVIALLSAAYQHSEYCRVEYNSVLSQDPLNLKQRLIVLRVEDCKSTGNLSSVPYVDLVPILHLRDLQQREAFLRRAISQAIGIGDVEGSETAALKQLQQVLHPDIAPVPSFTGRDAELAAIAAALASAGTAALTGSPAATALSGLGGVGKSALAREYAWRERARYRGVWWLRAEERATLIGDLIELGARFIPGLAEVPDREAAARAALDFIAQTPSDKPWLLIYDNAENPAGLDRLTPRAGAQVLVTSRWQDWHGRARELPLEVFSEAAALEFLMAQARGSAERPDETRAAAGKLAEDLGRLPLALAFARAHAWSMGWTFAQYREHLAQTKLLEREQTKGVDYPRSIAATFTLAIEKAKAASSEAARLLGIAAFLAPDRIPLGIITKDVMSDIEKGEAVAALAEVSLITRETLDDGSPAIGLHRLVQDIVRRRFAQDSVADAALAVRLVADAFPNEGDDIRNWRACRRLLPHGLSVMGFAPDTHEPTARLARHMSLYCQAIAEYATAEPLMRRALAVDEASFGPNEPVVAVDLNNLAQLLLGTNRLGEAEPLVRRALAIDEARLGSAHPNVATSLHNLALLLANTNRLAEAEPLMRRALAIGEEGFGPGHPNVARDLNNLAQLLKETNRLAEAEPLMRRALAIDEESFGPGHPNVASALNNLAALLQATNRLAEAEPLMRRALAIDEEGFGPGHPNVARDLNNLAALFQATNRFAEAEPLMRRALAIDEESFGPGHPNVASALNNLAQLLKETNRLAEAEPLMRRALAIFEESFGPGHPNVASALNNLAALLQATNRLAEAEPLMRHALAVDEESFGPGHPNVATALNNLAQLLQAMNRYAEAEPLMRRALAILEASLPDHHPWVQGAQRNLEALLAGIRAGKQTAPGQGEDDGARRGWFPRLFAR